MLINTFFTSIFAQKDTIYTKDQEFNTLIKAFAKDSMVHDQTTECLHLYGEAKVNYDLIQLEASYLMIDFRKDEILATYTLDKDSNKVGIPKFKDGSDEIFAEKIRYNFETEKGFITQAKIQQDETFMYMETAKRHPNEHVHFKNGRLTSCSLEDPHFHFFLTKAILIPDKRIVSGPMNLWIQGVPTPLGLPFVFIPQKEIHEKKSGFLFPQYTLQSSYGMGIQNLGYYIPINDSLQTTIYADIYTKGSWGINTTTDYEIKYRFNGSLQLGVQHFNTGFPYYQKSNKISVQWQHKQDAKANPYWNFTSNVNFMSDNSPKTNLDPINPNYFQNSLNSDININRNFPGKPITSGLKLSVRQNSKSNQFAVTSPSFTFNVTRFSPFAWLRKEKAGSKKWFEQIGMTYNIDAQNRSTFHDSLFTQSRYDLIGKSFLNGIQQGSTIQTTVGVFKNTWKINPSVNYTNKINFQQTRKYYIDSTNSTGIDTLPKAGMSHSLSFQIQATSVIYSYYRFIGKNKTLLRHLFTPSFGFRYSPKINKEREELVGSNQSMLTYSPFERSLYPEGIQSSAGLLTFSINNTFELKHKSKNDSTGFKKIRLIEALSFAGNYDLLKDSMRLSNISGSLRISPLEWIGIVSNANFSPYDWDNTTQIANKNYAINQRGVLLRLLNISFNTSLQITDKKSRKKVKENQDKLSENWNSDLVYYSLHPFEIIDFQIPWKMSFTHVLDLNRKTGVPLPTDDGRSFNRTHTLRINGDVSITKRWKVVMEMHYDVGNRKVNNTRFTITRDMHCWNMALYWTPIGGNQSFLLRISANASLLQSAKIELRKPPTLTF